MELVNGSLIVFDCSVIVSKLSHQHGYWAYDQPTVADNSIDITLGVHEP